MKKRTLILMAVIGLMLFGMVGCGSDSKSSDSSKEGLNIDLNNYMSVEVTGYSSVAMAEISFDYDAFEMDYKDKIKVINNEGNDSEINFELNMGEKPIDVFMGNCIGFEADKTEGLSNGDVVTVNWNCNDASAENYFGCTLKYSVVEYKVEGLEEIATFNPFDDVSVEFTGAAPYGGVNIIVNTDKKEMQYIEFTADNGYDLSNGDKVIVNANIENMDGFLETFKMVPSPMTMEFTVEGLPTYAKSISDISEEALNEMKVKAEKIYKTKWNEIEGNMEGLKNLTYIGNYFLNKKVENGGLYANQIYLLYKVDAAFEGNTYPHYMYIKFVDVGVDEEGKVAVDFENYEEVNNRWNPTDSAFFYYFGYGNIEDLFNDTVEKVKNDYAYEKNIIE